VVLQFPTEMFQVQSRLPDSLQGTGEFKHSALCPIRLVKHADSFGAFAYLNIHIHRNDGARKLDLHKAYMIQNHALCADIYVTNLDRREGENSAETSFEL